MQWNRFGYALAAILLSWTAAFGQEPRTEYSAKVLVETALQRNREYLAARAKVTEADALVRQAGIRKDAPLSFNWARWDVFSARHFCASLGQFRRLTAVCLRF